MSCRCAWVCFALVVAGAAQEQPDLTQLSLDDLGNIQVTSASRKAERLSQAPAAIYVLTGEIIRQGGFTSLPDALRSVPGLYVAQTDDHIWQISARGFSELNNNKMLVLVDGRSVYTPLYGGVYWDALDIPPENIDRVEVIRGPGGTLWGANAVNGVINVVTKSADQAQGTMVDASFDKDQGYTTSVRYGSAIGSSAQYYVFGRTAYWEPFQARGGGCLPNRLLLPQAGLRLDWRIGANDSLSLAGGAYDGRSRAIVNLNGTYATTVLKGNNAQVHWKHSFSGNSTLETLAACDWYSRYSLPGDSRTTCDVEFQHDMEVNERNSLVWGGAFNTTGDDLSSEPYFFTRLRRRNSLESGFAQYGFAILPDRLRVIAGTKLEHNGYSGFEYQPQIRAVWIPGKAHTLWTSISRAVRVPSRGENDLALALTIPNAGPHGEPVLFGINGNTALQSEHLRAYEAGYRFERAALALDLAAFYNAYDNLIVQRPSFARTPAGLLLEYTYVNGGRAQSHGAELSAQWRPVHRWTLSGGITETRGSADALQANPRHLFNLQSQLLLNRRFEFNTAWYHYGAVPLGSLADYPTLRRQSVKSFDRLDVGGTWHLLPQWSFGVWGRNLQSPRHLETRDTIFSNRAGEVPRSVVFKLMWQSKHEPAGAIRP
ncbi:MAG TPA: TonB-dependent receptor [Terriglobales bacterium]